MISQSALKRLVSPELNLSPGARTLILHVSVLGDGDHEIEYVSLRRLLQLKDDKKLRAVIEEAVNSGWLGFAWKTGKGHHPRFRYKVPENGAPNDNPPKNGNLNPDKVPKNGNPNDPMGGTIGGENSAHTPTNLPTSQPVGVREGSPTPEEIGQLQRYVRAEEFLVDPVALFARSAEHGAMWAAAILANYGPGGARELFWRGVPERERPGVLATALTNYATDARKPYDARLFDRYMDRARDQRDPAVVPLRRANARASPSRADLPPDAQEYHPKPYVGLNA